MNITSLPSSLDMEFNLTDQETVPPKHFISRLPSIEPGVDFTVRCKTTSTSVRRALVFAGLTIVNTTTEADETIYTVRRVVKNTATTAQPPASAAVTPSDEFSAWGINPNAKADIIDDTTLLAGTTTVAPQFDCGSGDGPRKACKNCTCGLADQETEQQQEEMRREGGGGCGNCSLGDAFRCAGCPSLGKPAWKTVEKTGAIKLNMVDDF